MPLISYRGGTYEGEINSQKLPHGSGTLKYTNGDYYKGQWEQGKPHGKGQAKGTIDEKKAALWKKFTTAAVSITTPDVSQGEFTYDGEWKDGKMHGQGMYTFPNGDMYDGEWQNNVATGTGMYMYDVRFFCYVYIDGTALVTVIKAFGKICPSMVRARIASRTVQNLMVSGSMTRYSKKIQFFVNYYSVMAEALNNLRMETDMTVTGSVTRYDTFKCNNKIFCSVTEQVS